MAVALQTRIHPVRRSHFRGAGESGGVAWRLEVCGASMGSGGEGVFSCGSAALLGSRGGRGRFRKERFQVDLGAAESAQAWNAESLRKRSSPGGVSLSGVPSEQGDQGPHSSEYQPVLGDSTAGWLGEGLRNGMGFPENGVPPIYWRATQGHLG